MPPEFCFPTHRLDRAPGVEDYVCRASPPQKHFEVEEKEIDATQSIEDLEEDEGEGEDDVPKTQRAGYEQQAEIVLQEGAPDHEGAATPSVVPATNGPAQLAPLRPTKGGWWSSQKDSTSPHSGDNNRNSKEDASKGTSKDTSGHGREGYEMPEAKRVRREEVVPSSPEAQRPMHQQIHQQGTQQSGGIFTPATYALKLSQKSLGYPSASAPPSSARVAGAAKGATPMFVSLDPPYDRTEHGISPPPPCGTGVSIYKRDLT